MIDLFSKQADDTAIEFAPEANYCDYFSYHDEDLIQHGFLISCHC